MILTFEEGEVEYDKEMLEKTNSFVVNIENMEDFTKRICQRMSEKLLSRPCHDRIQWNVLY